MWKDELCLGEWEKRYFQSSPGTASLGLPALSSSPGDVLTLQCVFLWFSSGRLCVFFPLLLATCYGTAADGLARRGYLKGAPKLPG